MPQSRFMRLWHFPRWWKEFKLKENMEYVSTNARIPFRCERCARCCRNLENALMFDPFDIYNLSKHLREQGQEIIVIEDMLARFAHPNLLEGIYPIFQVNTEGEDHACVFLKDDRCSVYEARPQVCRMYPFGVSPGERGRDFYYCLFREQQHHFGVGSVKVKDWLDANFPREARDFLKAHYEALPELGKALQALGEEQYKGLVFKILYYLYFGYDLSKPFLPQYRANMAELMKLLKEETKEETSCTH